MQSSHLISVEQALQTLLSYSQCRLDTIFLPIEQALGYVLSDDVVSNIDIPPKDNSSMDGYAIKVENFDGQSMPLSGRISAGQVSPTLADNTAVRIFTGAQIPNGADCVVPQEECEQASINGVKQVEIFSMPSVGDNIRKQGEDLKQGDIILEKGRKIRAQEIGLFASIGLQTVPVYRALKVAIFSTGDELINPGTPLKQGQIYNSNRYTLLGLLADMAVKVIDLGVIKDDFNLTKKTLLAASKQADLIITTGGVSVGEEDYIKTALEEIGELMMWKIRMKPGRPLAFGRINQAFFMGLPGNPVSTFAVFNLFVRPFMVNFSGQIGYQQRQYLVEADFNWLTKGNRREYLRAKVEGSKVAIYPNQGSGVLSSVSWADGFCCIQEDNMVRKGDLVPFIPFSQWGNS